MDKVDQDKLIFPRPMTDEERDKLIQSVDEMVEQIRQWDEQDVDKIRQAMQYIEAVNKSPGISITAGENQTDALHRNKKPEFIILDAALSKRYRYFCVGGSNYINARIEDTNHE